VRVLQQVEQALLELRGIDAGDAGIARAFVHELDLRAQLREEARPLDRLQPRRRQLGEARVVADETFEMACAFLDRRQRIRQPLVLAAAQQLRAGMRERGDRRQRVVELVADHADHLLPGLHFLPAQLRGELSQQHEFVFAAVEAEAAAGEMVDVLVVFVADGEHAIAATLQRFAQGIRRALEQRVERLAFELVALAQQLPCGEVGVDDAVVRVDQQHRHRRVLDHGVEQQFALHQRQALLAQRIAETVVRGDQFRELALAAP
jgi:hypothetical protein